MIYLNIDEGHAIRKYEVYRGDGPKPESVFTRLDWFLERYKNEQAVRNDVVVEVWERSSLFRGEERCIGRYVLAEFVHMLLYLKEKAMRPELV